MSNRRYDLNQTPSHSTASYLADAPSELDFVYTPTAQTTDANPLRARLLYVTSAKYEGDWQSIPHSHGFSELFLVLDGRGQLLANGERQDITRNDLIIINPLVEHAEFSKAASPLEYIVLGIDGLQFGPKHQERGTLSAIRLPGASSQIRWYMERLLEEVQQNYYGHDTICQYLLNIILILIMGHQKVNISITAARNISPECAALKSYIDTHFKEPLTLDDLAKVSHQNKYYIAHAFKSAFGISPIRYLTERRVDEGKQLLEITDYSISLVATLAGFSSMSVFTQTFKRITSQSPNEYRKACRRKADGKKSSGVT